MTASGDDMKAADWSPRHTLRRWTRRSERSWLKWIEDTDHQQAYENCELAWELSAELRNSPRLAALLAGADARVTRHHTAPATAARPKWRVPVWQVGIAASVIAVGVLAWLFFDRSFVTHYTTAVGEQRAVALPDGSTVLLNTDSEVRVELSRHLRRIELARGEALFSVAHDPARPFEVHALQGVTTAVGTQFDVEIVRSGAAVSVLEGTVTVGGANTGAATPTTVAVSAGSSIGYTQEGTVSELRPPKSTASRAGACSGSSSTTCRSIPRWRSTTATAVRRSCSATQRWARATSTACSTSGMRRPS